MRVTLQRLHSANYEENKNSFTFYMFSVRFIFFLYVKINFHNVSLLGVPDYTKLQVLEIQPQIMMLQQKNTSTIKNLSTY